MGRRKSKSMKAQRAARRREYVRLAYERCQPSWWQVIKETAYASSLGLPLTLIRVTNPGHDSLRIKELFDGGDLGSIEIEVPMKTSPWSPPLVEALEKEAFVSGHAPRIVRRERPRL